MIKQAVEAHVPPGKHPFVFKDKGSVFVFCVPVLLLCSSVVCVLVSVCTKTGMCSCFVCVHAYVLSVYVQACHRHVLCVYEGTCVSVCNTCCIGM